MPTHLSDVKPHPCENNTHTHRAQPLYRKTNPTPAWPWPPHPHKHRRTLPLGFCVSANTGTPEVQCLCSRSVSKSMIVYLSFHIRVYTCVCLQKQCIRGLRGLLVNSGEIKAAARRCRVMALCVGVSFNSLAELHCVCELVLVRCMYIFMSVWRRVCVHVAGWLCVWGIQERALASISPASARLLFTHPPCRCTQTQFGVKLLHFQCMRRGVCACVNLFHFLITAALNCAVSLMQYNVQNTQANKAFILNH